MLSQNRGRTGLSVKPKNYLSATGGKEYHCDHKKQPCCQDQNVGKPALRK